jgi:hypothetical protein
MEAQMDARVTALGEQRPLHIAAAVGLFATGAGLLANSWSAGAVPADICPVETTLFSLPMLLAAFTVPLMIGAGLELERDLRAGALPALRLPRSFKRQSASAA